MIKVLVVDDSALMRRVLSDIFRSAGDMQVQSARDGTEALAMLADFSPDVVTLDVTMPQMDGLSCLDRIMLLRPCPVIMVSALTDAGAATTLEAMQLGAVDFFAKPGGAISLARDEIAPVLIDKVRAAARARLRPALRLTERVRMLATGAATPKRRPAPTVAPAGAAVQTTARTSPHPPNCVVLVGASTGGPPALDALLSRLPADFPWPVVVAQHMPSAFTGPLARRLDKLCALTVLEVIEPTPVSPGNVYIAKGDADILFAMRPHGPIVLPAPSSPDHRWHPSVDRLVASAMGHLAAERLVGVLMTGMGNDGATTMTRLHHDGGRTIAEAEETAVVWGMPGELVKAGGADLVSPLHRIADCLLEWAA